MGGFPGFYCTFDWSYGVSVLFHRNTKRNEATGGLIMDRLPLSRYK